MARMKGSITPFVTYSAVCRLRGKGSGHSICLILLAYNTIEHASTGHSPYELMFEQKAQLPVDFLLGTSDGNSSPNTTHVWIAEHQDKLNPE